MGFYLDNIKEELFDEDFGGGCCNCECEGDCIPEEEMSYLNQTEVAMSIEALDTHIKYLKGMSFSANDPEYAESLIPEIASFEILKAKLTSLLPVEEEEDFYIDEEEDLSQYRNEQNVRFIRTAELALGRDRINLEVLDDKEFVEYLSFLDITLNNAIENEGANW